MSHCTVLGRLGDENSSFHRSAIILKFQILKVKSASVGCLWKVLSLRCFSVALRRFHDAVRSFLFLVFVPLPGSHFPEEPFTSTARESAWMFKVRFQYDYRVDSVCELSWTDWWYCLNGQCAFRNPCMVKASVWVNVLHRGSALQMVPSFPSVAANSPQTWASQLKFNLGDRISGRRKEKYQDMVKIILQHF